MQIIAAQEHLMLRRPLMVHSCHQPGTSCAYKDDTSGWILWPEHPGCPIGWEDNLKSHLYSVCQGTMRDSTTCGRGGRAEWMKGSFLNGNFSYVSGTLFICFDFYSRSVYVK